MKRKIIPVVLTPVMLTALMGLAMLSFNKISDEVSATPHADNFDDYTYVGDYYNEITATEGGTTGELRQQLTDLIFPEDWPIYGSSGTNHLSELLQDADEDPTNTSNMIYLYTRDSVTKNAASSWNREHVWARSLSGGNWTSQYHGSDYAATDLLHLRPTYNKTNSDRGSLLYGWSGTTSVSYYSGMPYAYYGNGYFEPLDSVKGDIARICMYVYVAYMDFYNNTSSGWHGMPEITNVFESYDTLLEWHTLDKPDVHEGHRNDFSESSLQKNRNPFVDHPEYAWKIFSNKASESVLNACKAAYPDGGSVTPTLTSVTMDHSLNKTEYYQNEDVDTSGLVLTAHYDIGGDKDVTSQATYSFTNVGNVVGQKELTISVLGYNFNVNINVNEAPSSDIEIESISVASSMLELKVGDTSNISYTINPSNAYPVPNISYEVDIPEVVSINNGVITALIEGECTITVKATQNTIVVSDTINVHVTKADTPVDPVGPDDPDQPVTPEVDVQKYFIIGAIVAGSAGILSVIILTAVLVLMIVHRIVIR